MTTDMTTATTTAPVPGGTWAWWPQVVVRSAGFPCEGVLDLAVPDLARHADAMVRDGARHLDWSEFGSHYEAATTALGAQIQRIAASERFRLAVTWQNHRAAADAIGSLLRWRPGPGARHKQHRKHEDLIASYWQRYCVKNDTIGFFGPVGWGRLTAGSATRFAPGREVIASSEVFFEPWAIDRLAEALETEPGMREWLAPKRAAFIRFEQGVVIPPAGPPVRLSPLEARVLSRCDGLVRARDMAAELTGDDGLENRADVFAILRRFEGKRWITWKLDLPVTPWPEAALRRALLAVEDRGLRERAVARLDALESARKTVVACDGDSRALGTALSALDDTFTTITGTAATRHHGRAYGGRTLLYQDCRRDIDLGIGQDVVRAAAPVELLLRGGRWFCYTLAQALRARLHERYKATVASGGPTVDLATFWFGSMRLLRQDTATILAGIEAELTSRWESALPLPGGEGTAASRAHFSYADVAPRVAALFDAPHAGWSGARYFSPDIILAARNAAGIRQGRFELVLGELHMAINTQRSHCFVTQHPEPGELLRNVDRDFPHARLLPVLPKGSPPRLSIRTHPALIRDGDFMVAHLYDTVPPDRRNVVASRDVKVIESAGQLCAQLPGGQTFDLLDVFSEILMDAVIDRFRLFNDRPHTPRVTIDKVVISREKWQFDPGSLPFANEKDEARRFVAARAWGRACGMPRHVFAKPLGKEKPMYFDFDSPLYVNLLTRLIRRSARASSTLTVTEMLPGFEQAWLTDLAGNRYMSELRLTAVDLLAPPEPGMPPEPGI